MKIAIIISSDGPVINREAKASLEEINELLMDEDTENARTKLAEFLDYATVLEDDAEPAKA